MCVKLVGKLKHAQTRVHPEGVQEGKDLGGQPPTAAYALCNRKPNKQAH